MALGRTLRKHVFRPTNIPAAIAALVAVVCGALADNQNSQLSDERSRAEVMDQVSLIRAKLEGDINGDIQLVRGIVADISTEPNITQARFAELSENLLQSRSQIKSIAGAPDLVVSMEYPLKGNEAVIGLDYRKNEKQRETALRARDSGDVVLAGPRRPGSGRQGLRRPFSRFHERNRRRQDFLGHSFRRSSTSTSCTATAVSSAAICRSTSRSPARTRCGKEGRPLFRRARGWRATVPSSPT